MSLCAPVPVKVTLLVTSSSHVLYYTWIVFGVGGASVLTQVVTGQWCTPRTLSEELALI